MMVILVKVLVGIIATFLIDSSHNYASIEAQNEHAKWYVSSHPTKSSHEKAFQILDNKCNVCHRKQNSRNVFTSENMDAWANEYQELLTWISSTKMSENGI